MTQSPCRYCTDRALGCHGLCKEYNDWALKYKESIAIEKKTMPRAICNSDFTGTSPRPSKHRKTRKSRH